MALTTNQKKVCRLLIRNNPDPDYMEALGASDDFALAEIAKLAPAMATISQVKADGLTTSASAATSEAELLNSVL